MEIKIRNYEKGDEEEIVDVFNRAFYTNLASLIRTKDSWIWRYVKRPGFKKENVILAVVEDRIVGTVMVTIREVCFDRLYRFGMIDDVATLPPFRGKGIARKMMLHAIEYMKSEGCDASALCADPRGTAKDLYLSLGYKYEHFFHSFVRPMDPRCLLYDIPFSIPLAPWLFLWSVPCAGKGGNVEFVDAENIDFLKALNDSYREVAGFSEIDRDFWKWMKGASEHRPLILSVKEGRKITGGANLMHARTFFLGFTLNVGWVTEFFFKGDTDPIRELVRSGKVDASFLLAFVSSNDEKRVGLLRKNAFVKFYEFPMMIKPFVEDFDLSSFAGRAWYPIFESAIGFP